jgi:LysM repeat protein
MKKFAGKYDVLMETTMTRFQNGGLLSGDVVKIKKSALQNEKIKALTQEYQDVIKDAINTDLNLRVGAVKSIRPNTTQNYSGDTDAPTDYYVDIVVEYAPGLWKNPITLPIEFLERVDTGINMAPIPDSLKRPSESGEPKEIIASDKDRSNPKTNAKMQYTKEPIDGRKGISKPKAYKENTLENLYGKMILNEEITGEDIGEGDTVTYTTDSGDAYEAIVTKSDRTGYVIKILSAMDSVNGRYKPGQQLQVSIGEIERVADMGPLANTTSTDSEMSDL